MASAIAQSLALTGQTHVVLPAQAALLFRLVRSRYEKGSKIITTNKSVKDWPEILARDEAMATAMLDRLLHHCHVFNIKGRSYRLREFEREMKS